MTRLTFFIFLFIPAMAFAQPKLDQLTVEKIMRDPKWMGTSPSGPAWSADGNRLYFKWNPDKAPSDSLYYITKENKVPIKASVEEKQNLVTENDLTYNKARSAFVYSKNGDIYFSKNRQGKHIRITQTEETESNPQFSFNESRVVYVRDQNLFAWDIHSGETMQLTNFQPGNVTEKKKELSQEEEWLKNDQLQYLKVLKERKDKKRLAEIYDSSLPKKDLKKIYIGDKIADRISISPNGQFINYRLFKRSTGSRRTIIPNYVTESGYTTDITGRTKVGESTGSSEFFIYDRFTDSVYAIKTDSIEGIRDLPDYVKDYPKELEERTKKQALREVNFGPSMWSPGGKQLAMNVYANDNKDRWILLWDAFTKKLKLLNRQRDEAWIGGPGMYNIGWIDENNLWFQSEETGYSHLYTINVLSGAKKALTSGKYEVLSAKLSTDKKYFFLSTNKGDPGQHQYYRLRISDSKTDQITTMTGANEVTISPDEKMIAILYSYSNKPWELYLQENQPGKKPQQITNNAQSEEFKSYPWKDPEIVTFTARDGATVYARLYKPANPDVHKPAVIFVHGAGYLQNAHKWWSLYFREYMFHNLLADNGYYVMDIDYRGSDGYGRDWRTGIYRHMGGKDLTDNVDASNYLVKNFGVDAKRIGVYGGSYGGFITLMAMFTTPDVFAAGAGLRSVTDWANYNDGYTSAILNEPFTDSLAYRRSSPIYYAEGLKGDLLMCHGMVDVNVHFQDIVKLSQRLIELKKDNWELAVYPMEDHGFVAPSSWTDEYKRIFKLFERVLKK